MLLCLHAHSKGQFGNAHTVELNLSPYSTCLDQAPNETLVMPVLGFNFFGFKQCLSICVQKTKCYLGFVMFNISASHDQAQDCQKKMQSGLEKEIISHYSSWLNRQVALGELGRKKQEIARVCQLASSVTGESRTNTEKHLAPTKQVQASKTTRAACCDQQELCHC